jgi:GH18 family chitinase
MAFTATTMPRITKAVDFINVMTYDLMNRRDTIVKHHSGVQDSIESIQHYISRGALPQQLNFGLGYYVKWFMASPECDANKPLGCPTQLLEDPDTGADLGKTGAFSWHDTIPEDLAESFARSQSQGRYFEDGSYGFLDKLESRWWSYDTALVASTKVEKLLQPLRLGGVFAWGLGEDAPEFATLRATMEAVNRVEGEPRDEL